MGRPPGAAELRAAGEHAVRHLQRIEGPARVHLDVESETPDGTVAQALDLGAELVAEPDSWRTLRSPGGLAFCVLATREHTPPEPVTLPDGHRLRLVQLCLDLPSEVAAEEVDFWRTLLPGTWAPSGSQEFVGKWHDDAGSPLQLLFQRLGESGGPVRAHLDLGTDDRQAEVRRLVDLGATDVAPGRGWHVLRDPAGQLFCVTDNSPEQVLHRELG